MKAFFVLSFIGLATLQAKYLQVGKPRPFYNATNALKSTFGENKQHLRCYDGPNQTGNYIDIDTDAVSDLSKAPYNFNDKIVSCDLNGIYFLYENYNFNPNLNVSFVSKCPPGISLIEHLEYYRQQFMPRRGETTRKPIWMPLLRKRPPSGWPAHLTTGSMRHSTFTKEKITRATSSIFTKKLTFFFKTTLESNDFSDQDYSRPWLFFLLGRSW